MSSRILSLSSLVVPLLWTAGFTTDLTAQTVLPRVVNPTVFGSILDQPRDGFGDSLETGFSGLIREQSTRENRAIQEFDLTDLRPEDIFAATLDIEVSVNNAQDNGPRTFDFLLYDGNGTAEITDFEIAGVVVGSGSYAPPMDTSFSVTLDVTAELRTLLASGSGWIGLKADPTSNPNFPNILDSANTLTIDVGLSEFGTGTSWTSGSPVARFGALPAIGVAVPLDLSDNTPNSSVFWLLGLSSTGSPVDLSVIGFQPGSFLLVNPLTSGTLTADAAGDASAIAVTVPNLPAILGSSLFAQSLCLDPALPFPIPIAVSAGVEAVIR